MTHADTARLVALVRRTADLIDADLDTARRRAAEWRTPSRQPDGPGPRGHISDPTGTAATTTHRDPTASLAADLDRHTRALAAACTDLAADLDRARTVPPTRTGIDAADATALITHNRTDGYCEACSTYAAGTNGDRLRPIRGARFCDPCRKAWARLIESGDVTYADIDHAFTEFLTRRATRTQRTQQTP